LFTLSEGYHAFTQVQFRYQNKDFQHGRFTSNSLRDGKNWLAGITQYILFAENTGNVRLGYTFDTDRTGGAPRPPSAANTPTPTGPMPAIASPSASDCRRS